jgi:broad specificity phosphatase PhoE
LSATTLDWARHGENVANLSRTLSHRVFDGDLTDRGRAEAQALGARLAAADVRYTLLACSPLRRAVQTAEIVGALLDLSCDLVLEEFREFDVGTLDGRNDEPAWTEHDAVRDAWLAGDLAARFPAGEDGHELTARVGRGLRAVAKRAGAGPALIVAHGGNLRGALPGLAGVPYPEVGLATGELARLRVSPDRIELVAWPLVLRPIR